MKKRTKIIITLGVVGCFVAASFIFFTQKNTGNPQHANAPC